MSKDREFPAMKWHPETGEPTVFNSAAEVPEGYLDAHPSSFDNTKKAAPAKSGDLPMARDEIVAALTAGGVQFKGNTGTKSLYDLLVVNLKAHLTAAEIAFSETATAPELLALIPKE